MKKLNICIVVILFLTTSLFCKETLPTIKNDEGSILFFDMSIEDAKKVLGEPSKISVELFTKEKPEFDEIFWEYENGVTISFYRGFQNVRKIIIESGVFFLEHDNAILKVGETNLQDVKSIWGKGYELKNNGVLRVEYTFKKIPKSYICHDIIQFYFQNNTCTTIYILDSSEYL